MAIEYDDVEVEVSHGLRARQQEGDTEEASILMEVRILHSPFDRPRETFSKPLDPETLKDFLEAWEKLLIPPKPRARTCRDVFSANVSDRLARKLFEPDELEAFFDACERRSAGTVEAHCRKVLAERVGDKLSRALFHGKVGETFKNCLAGLDAERRHRNAGLRLRISFGERERYLPEIIGLPWELLYRSDIPAFLGSGRGTQVVRYLDTPRRILPLETDPPLKVLAVFCAPSDQDPIKLAEQKLRLQEALFKHPAVELRFLEHATLAATTERLLKDRFHVLHFLGHGGFREQEGEGVLYFESPDGKTHKVRGTELANQLDGINTLRLVVLNTCVGARMLRERGHHPFTGAAPALIAAGLPAVVAMQFKISQTAAFRFSSSFYAKLGEGCPVDEAVAEARLAMQARDRKDSFEWATPVLFLRTADGKILSFKETDAPLPAKRLAIFNVLDIGKEMMELAGLQIDLVRFFEGRFIKEPELWNGGLMGALSQRLDLVLTAGNAYHLDLAAPASVAFATGYLVQAKKGVEIVFTQRGARGSSTWDVDEPEPPKAPSWKRSRKPPESFPLTPGSRDVAVTISVANDVLPAVEKYLLKEDLKPPEIGHLITADLQVSQEAVRNGGHASRLANQLCNRIHRYTSRHEVATLHIFASAPNALLFLLGRLSQKFRRIQLYEYDFEGRRPGPYCGTYEPSITLPTGLS